MLIRGYRDWLGMEYPTVPYRYLYFYHKNEKISWLAKTLPNFGAYNLVSSVIYLLEYYFAFMLFSKCFSRSVSMILFNTYWPGYSPICSMTNSSKFIILIYLSRYIIWIRVSCITIVSHKLIVTWLQSLQQYRATHFKG